MPSDPAAIRRRLTAAGRSAMLFVPHDWRLALATVLLAGLFDVTIGEPPNSLHPVVWMGRLIGALMGRRPHGRPRAEFAYGVAHRAWSRPAWPRPPACC